MKVSDIVTELNTLEQKRDEINNVLVEAAYGEPQAILERALVNYQKKVDTFLDAEFEPVATVIYLNASPTTLSLNVDDTAQLDVVATLSNGQTKNVTVNKLPMMLFRDFDKLANNVGVITSVDISGYSGDEATFEIVKTNNGFDVDDDKDTQGLQVVPTPNPNEFEIVDINGSPLGVKFVTNGEQSTGDNWLINIYWVSTGTTYSTDDPGVATVNEEGLVTAVGGGTANIIVQNGLQQVQIPITVTDTVAPEPPEILSIAALVEGAEITFDPSTSLDAATYNIYVNGVQTVTGVTTSPVTITLSPADGITSYDITMTTVDSSGNESEQSNAVTVTPLSAPTE